MSLLDRIASRFKKAPREEVFLGLSIAPDVRTAPKGLKAGMTVMPEKAITPEELERAYRMDEIVYGIVNKYVTIILGAGYMITGEDERAVQEIEAFCRKVQLEEILREVIRDLWIFGYSFVEIVYDKAGADIVDLRTVDAKTMDFKRDSLGAVIYDEAGLPVGFVQKVWRPGKGLETIEIDRERIAFFKLFTTSGSIVGTSPIEALYHIITWRKNIDLAMGKGSVLLSTPPVIVNVGEREIPVSQDTIKSLGDELAQMGPESVFVFPWHVKVTRLEVAKGLSALKDFSDYFARNIATALLVPPALIGVGDVASGRTAAMLMEEWERSIEGIQRVLGAQIRKEIFSRVCKVKGLKEVPEITWRAISPSIRLSGARRRATYARAGLLTWDQSLENYIRREEGLPLLERQEASPRPTLEEIIARRVAELLSREQEAGESEEEERAEE